MTTAVEVRERPILFSGEMVRAILDGRKTQTRRVIKPQPSDPRIYACRNGLEWCDDAGVFLWDARWEDERGRHGEFVGSIHCPYGQPGDRLWVRETWFCPKQIGGSYQSEKLIFGADRDLPFRDYSRVKWHPSIFMPRWASRITLEITDVRVERVQEIAPDDVAAVGVVLWRATDAGEQYEDRELFARLWDQINGPRGFGWDANPFVWVISFRQAGP